MWTLLVAGVCGAVLEHGSSGPMVLIGNVLENKCIWQYTLLDGADVEHMILIGAGDHSFKIKIGETSALVSVDGREFKVPRGNSL